MQKVLGFLNPTVEPDGTIILNVDYSADEASVVNGLYTFTMNVE